jgi:hypothetical protein
MLRDTEASLDLIVVLTGLVRHQNFSSSNYLQYLPLPNQPKLVEEQNIASEENGEHEVIIFKGAHKNTWLRLRSFTCYKM